MTTAAEAIEAIRRALDHEHLDPAAWVVPMGTSWHLDEDANECYAAGPMRPIDGTAHLAKADARYIAAANPEALRAILDRMAELERANAWQPIDTAPKDGTSILLAASGRVTAGHWEPERWPVAAEHHSTTGEYLGQFETGECIEAWWHSEDGGFDDEHPPTHWRPLPTAPDAADRSAG